MASSHVHLIDGDDDHLVVHQYIRRFGRRPSPMELAQYRRTLSRDRYRPGSRLRRRLAAWLTRP